MDDHAKKRPAGGLEFCKRCSDLSFGKQKHEDGNFHECKRTECSTGHNSNKSTQSRSSEKIKYLKPPLRFKSSNPNATSSSRSSSSSINLNMSCHGSQNRKYLEETNIADCSNGQAENENRLKFDLEFPGRKKVTEFSRSFKPPILHCFPSISPTKMSSNSKATFASRVGKQISQSSVSSTQDNVIPPFCQSLIPRFACQIPKSVPQCAIGRSQRHSLKTLGCESISDSLPKGSLFDGHDKRDVSLRKKFQNGEGCSSGMPSLKVQQVPHDISRTKKQYNGRDTTVSFRTYPSSEGESSRMTSNEEEEQIFELPGPILFPTRPHTPSIISEAVQERSPILIDLNTSFARRPRSHSRSFRHRSVSNFVDVDGYFRLNMEGIAEVLQEVERIKQDEELTYEQIMVLEATLLEGFGFYDQHRDMRLDIDNMSYEDLLALEEKMGSVSTALPEEALSKCLKKITYRTNFPHMTGISGHGNDDFKCSICQEEYMTGEELGRLPCKHYYHVTCIQQWLRLKNWCPICKDSALSQKDHFF